MPGMKMIDVKNLKKGDIFLWSEYADRIFLCIDVDDSSENLLRKHCINKFDLFDGCDSFAMLYLCSQFVLRFYLPFSEKTNVLLIDVETS